MSKELPFLKFFPTDWLGDERLRTCSLVARGLWIDLLCMSWRSGRRGYLESAAGKPVTHEQIARAVGESPSTVGTLLAELENAGVFSREAETGVIYSRRLVRDVERTEILSQAGKRGGNPRLSTNPSDTLKPTLKPRLNPTLKPTLKGTLIPRDQSPESRNQTLLSAANATGEEAVAGKKGSRVSNGNPLFDAVCTACRLNPSEAPGARIGKVLRDIREATPDVTPAEIATRSAAYRQKYRDADLTPEALAKHWSGLGPKATPATTLPDNVLAVLNRI